MANWERKEIALRTMATGHVLTAPVFRCHGRSERPLAYIQANVHGGELQGNAAILALFDLLEKESPRGSIVLVPRVNPVSANQQVGDYVAGVYDFGSGHNFNRGYVNLTGPSRGSSACYVDVDAFAAVHRDATLCRDPRRLPRGPARRPRGRARGLRPLGHREPPRAVARDPGDGARRRRRPRPAHGRPRAALPLRARGHDGRDAGVRDPVRPRGAAPVRRRARRGGLRPVERPLGGLPPDRTARTSAVSSTASRSSSAR